MKITAIAAVVFCALAQVSEAALIGTELGLQGIYQATSTSPVYSFTSLNTVTVREPGIEIPSTSALAVSNPTGLPVVNLSINAGNDFLDIGFANSAPYSLFASAYRNSYVFTFDSTAKPTISSAFVDPPLTTLGLTNSDLRFAGNTLEVNVHGLSFNPSSFARIELTSLNPVPLPAAVWLFGTGVIGLGALANRKRASQ
jgi:hypothetical protein